MDNAEAGVIEVEDERRMAVVRDPVRLGIFETIRRHRRGATLAELATAGLTQRQLSSALDDLLGIGLIKSMRARKGSATRYLAQCQRITLVANPQRPDHVTAVRSAFRDATNDIALALQESDRHGAKFRPSDRLIDIRLKLDLQPEEWKEFMQRLRAVYDYLQVVSESRTHRAGEPLAACDHVLAIRLLPARAPLLPAPTIRHASAAQIRATETKDPDSVRQYEALSAREREVVVLVAAGTPRPRIAERLGVSVNTVSTLVRRAYQKLDVTNREQLQFRLARIDGRQSSTESTG